MKAAVINHNGEDVLVIELPITPGPSRSGKTTLLATTCGFTNTEAEWKGEKIKVSVNAIVPR